MKDQIEKQAIKEMAKCCTYYHNGECCADATKICDCDLMCEMFGVFSSLESVGYRKQSEVVMEIIGIINKRREINQYHLQGNNTDLFHGIYCGRDEAYRDIAEIIEQKFGAKMKGGAQE